jgi:hypothetical protein
MENMALGLTTEAVSANLLQSFDMNINTQIMGNKYAIQRLARNYIFFLFNRRNSDILCLTRLLFHTKRMAS